MGVINIINVWFAVYDPENNWLVNLNDLKYSKTISTPTGECDRSCIFVNILFIIYTKQPIPFFLIHFFMPRYS